MTKRSMAIGVSLGVHALVCCSILVAGSIMPGTRAVVLDFSFSRFSGTSEKQIAKNAFIKHRTPAERERTAFTPTENDEQAVPLPQEKLRERTPNPVSDQVARDEQAPGPASNDPSLSAHSAEAAQTAYLSSHFRHIRDSILKKLTYPMIARTRGWSGKVTVAFTVCADGSVEGLSVVESSGFQVLDNNALETIRKSCPLPRPPMKTALLMPVVYRLE